MTLKCFGKLFFLQFPQQTLISDIIAQKKVIKIVSKIKSITIFVIVLEALSCEFHTGTPWELLYADDLVISAETEEGLKMKLNKWKTEMEGKGLRVNMGKTNIMVSGVNLQTLKDSGKYPCSVCRKGVGSNSIYCAGCSHWVHKKCSGVIGSLKSNPDCLSN